MGTADCGSVFCRNSLNVLSIPSLVEKQGGTKTITNNNPVSLKIS